MTKRTNNDHHRAIASEFLSGVFVLNEYVELLAFRPVRSLSVASTVGSLLRQIGCDSPATTHVGTTRVRIDIAGCSQYTVKNFRSRRH